MKKSKYTRPRSPLPFTNALEGQSVIVHGRKLIHVVAAHFSEPTCERRCYRGDLAIHISRPIEFQPADSAGFIEQSASENAE